MRCGFAASGQLREHTGLAEATFSSFVEIKLERRNERAAAFATRYFFGRFGHNAS
jgi:hypothetical protein